MVAEVRFTIGTRHIAFANSYSDDPLEKIVIITVGSL